MIDFVTHLPWTSRGHDTVGDSGPAYKVGTLFGYADDLHSGGILQVIYMGDSPVT